jgi:hypothetical protein
LLIAIGRTRTGSAFNTIGQEIAMNIRYGNRVTDSSRCSGKPYRWGLAAILSVAATLGFAPLSGRAQSLATVGYAKHVEGARSYRAASVLAKPGLRCSLQPENSKDASAGISIVTDHDGFARFGAVRATAADVVQRLSMNCSDAAGNAPSFSVDLTSEETFTPRPLDIAGEPGIDRPPLVGDPMAYSAAQLMHAGYGLRPDPVESPGAYERWVTAASKHARMLETNGLAGAVRHAAGRAAAPNAAAAPRAVTITKAPYWVGSGLTGAPAYLATEVTFNVPTGIAGGDKTTDTGIAIWNGLGGLVSGSGLIQGGVQIQTTPSLAAYGVFREYCCGDPNSNGYGGAFAPAPGDLIYSVQWYCNATGGVDANGGYGCSYVLDERSGALLSCTEAKGSPCASVKALPLCSVSPSTPNCMTVGTSAEFIVEDTSPQRPVPSSAFTDFTPSITMTGSAYTTQTGRYSQTISTDPGVDVLEDFTNAQTRLNVSLGTSDQTTVSVASSAHTIWKFQGGTCDVLCAGWVTLDDNPLTSEIAASNNNLYQLHTDGGVWKSTGVACTGYSCPGWINLDNNPQVQSLVADGSSLYEKYVNGTVRTFTGATCKNGACPGWKTLDSNPATADIAASLGNLYELHFNGEIWQKSNPISCTVGNPCPGWIRLDDNPAAVQIAADGNNLYQRHNNGEIWKYTGIPCNGNSCGGWIRLDDNPGNVGIAAGGGNLYQLHGDGSIWHSTGVACTGSSCPGWVELDDNPAAISIVANKGNLYQMHRDRTVWKWTGVTCTGASCPGWTLVNDNPMGTAIVAGGGQLYELY